MIHKYNIEGEASQASVVKFLNTIEQVQNAYISDEELIIKMGSHIPQSTFNDLLKKSLIKATLSNETMVGHEEKIGSTKIGDRSNYTIKDYIPLIVIFAYILFGSILVSSIQDFSLENLVSAFMGLFFIFFSLFKLLDLKGFSEGYAQYDIIAKSNNNWGYIYPFIELALGISYILGISPIPLNLITILVMGTAVIGVIQNLRSKKAIQCACLGTILKVPLTKITLIEDLLMIVMAIGMLVYNISF